MKGMMGALLMNLLLGSINSFSLFDQKEIAFSAIFLILVTALVINHFVINSDHHSSPNWIKLNQILAVLIVIVNAAWDIFGVCGDPTIQNILVSVLDLLGMLWVSKAQFKQYTTPIC